MNIDLGHRTADGFELIELKVSSNTPYDAALQILRYGAVYMLYRLDPDLARRFKSNSILNARHIILEVLAPHRYYAGPTIDLRELETQLNRDVARFASQKATGLTLAFRFMAFPAEFIYRPGMDRELLRDAVRRCASPFAEKSYMLPIENSYLVPGSRLIAGEYPGVPSNRPPAELESKLTKFLDGGVTAFVDLPR